MPNVYDTFPVTDYLKATDLGGNSYDLIISSVETIEYDDGYKFKIFFQDSDRVFVSNKTNSMIIADHHGPNTDHWTGKKITLYPTRVLFKGEMVDAIRVREKEVAQVKDGGTLGKASDHPNAPGQIQEGDPGISNTSRRL